MIVDLVKTFTCMLVIGIIGFVIIFILGSTCEAIKAFN